MAKSALIVTIKTPHSTVKAKDMTSVADLFYEEIENRAFGIAVQNLALSTRTALNRWYTIVATFFQRVCARTPLDEKYINGIDSKGNFTMHYPDKMRCRFDWYVECGGIQVTAGDMIKKNVSLFNEYNNSESINAIINILKETFSSVDFTKCTIGNDNPYFETLEYGGYDHDTAPRQGIVENGWETGEKHGVKNKHSVQAPMGMLRITQMELQSMIRSSASTSLSKRYRGQRTVKLPSDARMKQLVKQFKASKRLSLKDIKRYIDL